MDKWFNIYIYRDTPYIYIDTPYIYNQQLCNYWYILWELQWNTYHMYHIIYYLHVLDYMSVWITNSIILRFAHKLWLPRHFWCNLGMTKMINHWDVFFQSQSTSAAKIMKLFGENQTSWLSRIQLFKSNKKAQKFAFWQFYQNW